MDQDLEKLIHDTTRALSREIYDLEKSERSSKVILHDGRFMGERVQSGEYWYIYSFESDVELLFPENTKATMHHLAAEKLLGKTPQVLILSITAYLVLLGSPLYLGKEVEELTISNEPAFLLIALRKRLQSIDLTDPNTARFLQLLITDSPPPMQPPAIEEAIILLDQIAQLRSEVDEMEEGKEEEEAFDAVLEQDIEEIEKREVQYNRRQLQAIGHILANPVSFIWGPPGTGKSLTLGMAAAALVQRGERVLVLAHSNAAVDVAMGNVAKQLEGTPIYNKGQLIRYGAAVSKQLLKLHPQIHVRGLIKEKHLHLYHTLESLNTRESTYMKLLRELAPSNYGLNLQYTDAIEGIKKQRKEIHQKLRAYEKQLLEDARVIGCTLSKATIDSNEYLDKFDAVFIDEASMAYIPHCLFASRKAHQRIALFGDFRQLAPIAKNEESKSVKLWLKRDIFDVTQIPARIEASGGKDIDDPRLVMLRRQYRMHPDIAAVPNELYYHNLLISDNTNTERTAPTVETAPFEKRPLNFINTSSIKLTCFSDSTNYSRFNPVSALLAVAYAYKAYQSDNLTIGIITPYNGQVRLINSLLRALKMSPKRVMTSTVHRFQGSERDVIIFDTVEGRHKDLGKLFAQDSAAKRLTNVAISRAKGKFILLADHTYLKEKSSQKPLKELVDSVARHAGVDRITAIQWPTNTIYDGLIERNSLKKIYFYPQGNARMLNTLLEVAKEEVRLCWPLGSFIRDHHFDLRILQSYATNSAGERVLHLFGTSGRQWIRKFGHGTHHFLEEQYHPKIGIVIIDKTKEMWLFLNPNEPTGGVIRIGLAQVVTTLRQLFGLKVAKSENKEIS